MNSSIGDGVGSWIYNLTASPAALQKVLVDLDFLHSFADADIPRLINNVSFTNSLGCKLESQYMIPDYTSCAEVCGNVSTIFSSWPNFYTCSWYPALSEALAGSSPNGTQVDTLENFGITANQQDLSGYISSTVANCLAEYCQSSADCQAAPGASSSSQWCTLDNLLSTNGSTQMLNRTSVMSCLEYAICPSTLSVNPDIGGLGVSKILPRRDSDS